MIPEMRKLRAWRLFRTAQRYYLQGAPRRAAALYKESLAANPADRGAWLWRALALADCGRYGEAREHVERAIALNSAAAAGQLVLARILYEMGRADEARKIVSGYLEKADNQQARGLLALCLMRAGETENARQLLAVDLPHAPWLLSRLLVAIEEKAGAPPRRSSAQPVPKPGWRGGAYYVRRGLLHLRAERWEKALDAFRRAEGVSPESPKAAYGLGVSLYYLGHFEESRGRLLGALERLEEPFRSDAEATLGKDVLELGNTTEAVALLRRAIARGAATPENYYALGLALLRRGRPALARRLFERYVTPQFVRQRLAETGV